VFKRLFSESASQTAWVATDDTVFKVWLEYPSSTCEIGIRDYILIHYFDSPTLPDIRQVTLGQTYSIDIFANYLIGIPVTNGKQTFYGVMFSINH
jgi:hypothetical protein